MAASNFPASLDAVLAQEGGYVDHPRDPGGATNLGITRATLAAYRGRPVTKAQVRGLLRAEAAAIYRDMYWDVVNGDGLPPGLDLALFDFAVNSGPSRAIRMLQAVLGVKVDGIVGPATLAAIERADPRRLVEQLSIARLEFLKRLPTWRTFGRGWRRRVNTVEREGLAMAEKAIAERAEPAAMGEKGIDDQPQVPPVFSAHSRPMPYFRRP